MKNNYMKNNNTGICGHAKCAGGNGKLCYQQGSAMRPYSKDFYADSDTIHTPKRTEALYAIRPIEWVLIASALEKQLPDPVYTAILDKIRAI